MHLLRHLQEQAAEFAPVRSALGEMWHRSAEKRGAVQNPAEQTQGTPGVMCAKCNPWTRCWRAAGIASRLPAPESLGSGITKSLALPGSLTGVNKHCTKGGEYLIYLFILKQIMLFIKPSDGQAHMSAAGSQLLLGRETRQLQVCLFSAFIRFGCSFN